MHTAESEAGSQTPRIIVLSNANRRPLQTAGAQFQEEQERKNLLLMHSAIAALLELEPGPGLPLQENATEIAHPHQR